MEPVGVADPAGRWFIRRTGAEGVETVNDALFVPSVNGIDLDIGADEENSTIPADWFKTKVAHGSMMKKNKIVSAPSKAYSAFCGTLQSAGSKAYLCFAQIGSQNSVVGGPDWAWNKEATFPTRSPGALCNKNAGLCIDNGPKNDRQFTVLADGCPSYFNSLGVEGVPLGCSAPEAQWQAIDAMRNKCTNGRECALVSFTNLGWAKAIWKDGEPNYDVPARSELPGAKICGIEADMADGEVVAKRVADLGGAGAWVLLRSSGRKAGNTRINGTVTANYAAQSNTCTNTEGDSRAVSKIDWNAKVSEEASLSRFPAQSCDIPDRTDQVCELTLAKVTSDPKDDGQRVIWEESVAHGIDIGYVILEAIWQVFAGAGGGGGAAIGAALAAAAFNGDKRYVSTLTIMTKDQSATEK